jgi:uncharacterized repeat protein (TIGR01451 family)
MQAKTHNQNMMRCSFNITKSLVDTLRHSAKLALFLLLALFGAALVYAHGAWLNRPNIVYTAATQAQMNANIAAGNPPFMTGDVIELVAEFPTIVDGTLSGPNGYFTFYVPAGTQVVGASIVDASFNDIPARRAISPVTGEGISRGWGARNQTNFVVGANGWNPPVLPSQCGLYSFTAATCRSGLAHVYGDTGIFYSTRADTAFYTGDGSDVASLNNGYRIRPSNATPWSTIGGTGDARVHNKWDAVQAIAFGGTAATNTLNPGFTTAETTRITDGRGATPYKAGSPVAGPDAGNTLDRYGTTGPWQRISYAGSCYAQDGLDGPANDKGSVSPQPLNGTANSISICSPTGGALLSASSPLPTNANAVRYAIGGIHSGQTYRIKIRLRVLNASLIKAFNAEASGGDSTQGAQAGNDNMWRYWVGGPGIAAPAFADVLSIQKTIVAVNGTPYVTGAQIPPNATVRYRIAYANAGLTQHTNVQLSDVLPTQSTATSNFTVLSGANILPTSPAAPTSGTFTFTTIPTLNVGQGGAVEYNVALSTAAGQTVTNTGRITSTQRPVALTSAATATVRPPIANLSAVKTSYAYDPTGQNRFSIPGADMIYAITLTNAGDPINSNTLSIVDLWPSQMSYSLNFFDGTESVKFIDGTGPAASGLTCCNSSQILYSTDNGLTFAYIPPAVDTYLSNITHVKILPSGQMNDGNNVQTSFSIFFRGKVK